MEPVGVGEDVLVAVLAGVTEAEADEDAVAEGVDVPVPVGAPKETDADGVPEVDGVIDEELVGVFEMVGSGVDAGVPGIVGVGVIVEENDGVGLWREKGRDGGK